MSFPARACTALLLLISLPAIHACECALENARASSALPPLTAPALLAAYAERAAALRHLVVADGAVTYQDVVAAAYAPEVIDAAVLRHKATWRANFGDRFTFITDYALAGSGAAVESLVAEPDARLQSTLVAQYESLTHVISIAPVATDFAIFHEAGHALQRATLQARGGASGRRSHPPEFNQPAGLGRVDATTQRRFLYLSSQDEFEVRLQDLNRFHALLVASHPILSPGDSLRALTALGLPLEFGETQAAFALAGLPLSREWFEAHTAGRPLPTADIAVAFEDARELILVRRFALRVDPACWPRLLAKIVFEAPGHL